LVFYRCELTPVKVLGLEVRSIVEFETSFDGKTFIFECQEDSLQQKFGGIEFIANIVSSMPKQRVQGRTVCSYDRSTGMFSVDVTLQISFDLPNWLLVPPGAIQSVGSASLQTSVSSDTEGLIKNVVKAGIVKTPFSFF
jgi:Protein of unknown function (DUF1997)